MVEVVVFKLTDEVIDYGFQIVRNYFSEEISLTSKSVVTGTRPVS